LNELSPETRKHLESDLIRAAAELMEHIGRDAFLAQGDGDMYFAAGSIPEIQAMTREVASSSTAPPPANDNHAPQSATPG
jgi:hypothetical protein